MTAGRNDEDISPWRSVSIGDIVVRMLAGAPMPLTVTAADDERIYCGGSGGWTFDRATGVEVDDELGWGPAYGITGSFLLPPGEVDGDLRNARGTQRPRVPNRVIFRTETGSRYEVDNRARTWRRTPTLASGVLRSEEGSLTEPVFPVLGWPVVLIGERNPDGETNRVVVTTRVVEVKALRAVRRGARGSRC